MNPANAEAFNKWLQGFDRYKNYSLNNMLGIVDLKVDKWVQNAADSAQYKNEDYWAAPFETFRNRMGDCEDYAILKHYILTEYLGFSKNNCFLATANTPDGLHAFVLINLGTATAPEYFILDNDHSGWLREQKHLTSWEMHDVFGDGPAKAFSQLPQPK